LNHDANVPLSFFVQNLLQPDWIEGLPVNHESTRDLSLRLLGIFSDLITTISCLKDEDIDKESIITINSIEAVMQKLSEIQFLSTTDKKLIRPIIADVEDEMKRIDNNKEADKKKLFIDALNKINEII